jgi:DNA-binding transcriptional ArsR family regulator
MQRVAELPAADAAKAISHPLRATILNGLYDREASPVEIAKELGEPVGNVSYHARALLELGAIRLVRTRQRRGAIEHVYTATVRISLKQEPLQP